MNDSGPATGEDLRNAAALRLTLTALLVALAAGWSACDSGEGPPPREAESVRGMVVEVDAASLLDLESLTVLDDAGKRWTFVARGYRGFTPSHLNEHRVLGDPVTVVFHRGSGGLVIDDITD